MTIMGWVRAGYGTTLLVLPGPVFGLVARRRIDVQERTVVRVLGMREVGQALVCAPRPSAAVLSLSAGVDAVHALTMLALVVRSPTWRRTALTSGVAASTFAALALRDVRGLPRPAADAPRSIATVAPHLLDRLLDLRDRYALRVLDLTHAPAAVRTSHGGGR